MQVSLPYGGWKPRPYQRKLWRYLENGGKRGIEIAHRRWGKDDVALHHAACSVMQRPATLFHCLPIYAQARKAIWNAVNPHTGNRRIDEAFPQEIRESTNDQEMFIRFKNGGTWQVVGSDRYDTLVGASAAGVVFSEWALANPSAWGYIRPMVEENGGWALFITTPRGNNHAKAMYELAEASPDWFAEVSSIYDTGALDERQLAEALSEYQAIYGIDFGRAMFDQEYGCSFSGALIGAYFGAEINKAEREGRICKIEVDYSQPVHTAWDLGKAVNNPIWCFQVIKGRPVIVDFYQPESDDLSDWVKWLNDKGYNGNDYVPHDILVTEWGSKRTRFEVLQGMGRRPKRLPRVSVADGLQAARTTINEATFASNPRVLEGVEGLKNYRREWDDDRKTFRETPVKDWAEHIGSAFRYLGLAWRDVKPASPKEQKPTELVYTANADGTVEANMSVREIVEQRMRKRRAQE